MVTGMAVRYPTIILRKQAVSGMMVVKTVKQSRLGEDSKQSTRQQWERETSKECGMKKRVRKGKKRKEGDFYEQKEASQLIARVTAVS